MRSTIREVSVATLQSASRRKAQPREAMISITGTGERRAKLKAGWLHVLRLKFDDIQVPLPGRRLFNREDARWLIYFIDEIASEVDHVVVHCTHGMSRSPAIAKFISERFDLGNGFRNTPDYNRHVYRTLVKEGRR
jgi:predicted protein tyrosine phosphatase